MRQHPSPWLLVASLALACASGPHQHGAAPSHAARNLITQADIERIQARTAYDAIERLHAEFLHVRGVSSFRAGSTPEPIVYVDHFPEGTIASLRQIPATDIALIRLLRGWDASTKYGANHVGGVIEITTKQ